MQTSPPTLTHQQPAHLWDYWAVVMKRAVLVFVVAVGAVLVAWWITQQQEPQYRATATIEIVPPSVNGVESPFAPAIFSDDRYLDTQVEKLRMPATIERAVRAQKLSQLRDFEGKSDGDIVKMAHNRVEVSLRRNKLLMDVSVVGSDPRVLPHLANALVNEFREMQRSDSRVRREAARQDLEGRIGKLDNEIKLAKTDKRIQLEAKSFDEQTFEVEYRIQYSRLERFLLDRDECANWISKNRAAAEQMKKLRAAEPPALEALAQFPEVRDNPAIATLQREIDGFQDLFSTLRKRGVGIGAEEWVRTDQELERTRATYHRAVMAVVDRFLLDYQGQVDHLVDLDRSIVEVTAKVKDVRLVKAALDQKNEVILRADEEKKLLEKRLEPILAAQWDDRDAVVITQTAREPTEPFSPNRNANLTLGAIVGVLGGVALAFLLDYLDDTIRTKDELAKIADVPLLGIVPNIEGRSGETEKRDLFAHAQPKSTISEAYRGVRTALTLSAQGPMQKALLLTSAGPREGKTTTAINLATVLAYSGARTLLVDADLRKPRVHKSFGVANARGLTNLIIGTDDPLSACVPTKVERVDVLPSGPIPPNPSELLGHPRMREILRRLREHYDHIIIDTPPIGAVTDAAVLATVVDGVILVVHAGKTRRQIVMRGIEQLRYINARIVGVILNNLRMGRVRYYPGYYHYYYYYSSHYGAEEAPPPAETRARAGKGDDAA